MQTVELADQIYINTLLKMSFASHSRNVTVF